MANLLFTNTKVPTEIRHKTAPIQMSAMKGADWQTFDTFCLVSLAMTLAGPKDLKVLLLLYTFLIRILYICDVELEVINTRADLKKINLDLIKPKSSNEVEEDLWRMVEDDLRKSRRANFFTTIHSVFIEGNNLYMVANYYLYSLLSKYLMMYFILFLCFVVEEIFSRI